MVKQEKDQKSVNSKQTMEKLLGNFDIKAFHYGDLAEGVVAVKGKNELLVDIGGKSEGIITGKELVDEDNTFGKVRPGDRVLTFVIQAEDDQGYVVLSLKRAEGERTWRSLKKLREEGKPLEVKVVEFNRGGLIVDTGIIRGFIPISHLDRSHFPLVEKRFAPGGRTARDEILASLLGQTLQAQIIELDQESNKLILSEKLATAERSEKQRIKVFKKLKVGDVVAGIISSVLPFGVFIDIDGVEGLVHISELSWEKVTTPANLFSQGDKVKARVVEIDKEGNRISLSIKDLIPDPWKDADKKYQVGQIIEGEVTKITPYGAFVRLEPGISGLIHVSETSGPLKEGEKVRVQIISLEPEEKKLGLSVRQLEEHT